MRTIHPRRRGPLMENKPPRFPIEEIRAKRLSRRKTPEELAKGRAKRRAARERSLKKRFPRNF